MRNRIFILLFFTILNCNFNKSKDSNTLEIIEVTATAYNSVPNQTSGDPNITAFGDVIKPGMKYIAVSRDLLALGLSHNTPVTIKGLKGVYIVKDKMHSRWTKRIDIYMGEDVKAAKEWGKRKVEITYKMEKKSKSLNKSI